MKMTRLKYIPENAHRVQVDGRRILFHVPTTSIFELDELSDALLDVLEKRVSVGESDIRAAFEGRSDPEAVVETLHEFLLLDILQHEGRRPTERPRVQIEEHPLSTMVINVNTGCNLGCTYCYKQDLVSLSKGQRMDLDTAKGAFELLIKEAKERDRVNLVFFGGEPLTAMGLIREVVDYAEERCLQLGKSVDFSLTTNATLLNAEIIDFLDAHKFGITVSINGPKEIHDRHRKTVGGKGTYDVVVKKAGLLLSRYRSRPIGARVTLTSGGVDIFEIHRHLKYDLGFHEVGVSPVTAGKDSALGLDGFELGEVFSGMKRLGRHYLKEALEGRNNGFSNMHQLMTDLVNGTAKVLPCGAGIGLLAVDKQGDLNLCHRFTGSDLPTFGSVKGGIDKKRLGSFLDKSANNDDPECTICRIRHLCAGGCYHESYTHYNDPHHPVDHYCNLMREWIDFGIEIYVRIQEANPGFFEKYIEPRRQMS